MIKYRVHEVAKDLNVPNKDVLDALQKYCGETKKHMTALTEQELDVVFESFTQSHEVKSFDDYFAAASEPKVTVTQEAEPAAQPVQAARPDCPARAGSPPRSRRPSRSRPRQPFPTAARATRPARRAATAASAAIARTTARTARDRNRGDRPNDRRQNGRGPPAERRPPAERPARRPPE